jgi:Family of unknown function (DUF5681)
MFKKGASGNPAGRPPGARHRTTIACEALLDGQAKGLTQKAIELGLAGDMVALRVCLDRIVPVRCDRHVSFQLPKLETPADVLTAVSAIAEGVAAGELTPGEAGELSKLIDSFRSVVETVSFEARIAALEGKAAVP